VGPDALEHPASAPITSSIDPTFRATSKSLAI
jgi:hypothetical protein